MMILLIASPASALTTSDCFDCHSDDTLTKTAGGREVSLFVDEMVYGESIHGDLDCTDCHEDLMAAEDEHEELVEPVQCGNCHDDAAQALDEGGHPAECSDCHGKHDIQPGDHARSRIYDLNVPATCCGCHADEDMNPEVCSDWESGMHGIVLIRSGVIYSAVCNDCHGSHDIRPPDDETSLVNRCNINSTCSSCHAGIVDVYRGSVHGQCFDEGNEEAPVCTSCHGSHSVERAMDEEFLITVTDRCSGCHEEKADTFRDTYHGQVTGMGYAQAAQCPDCHGAHEILSQDDPGSMVHPDNLVVTCGQCHPGANRNFTLYLPHADYHDAEGYPQLYYVYLAMVILLSGVFFFFGIHTLLWFIRSYIEERNKREEKT